MRTIPLAVIALALGATTLAAQPVRGGATGGPRGAAIGQPRGAVAPAEALLRLRTQLELNDEQVQRLEALAASQRTALAASPSQQMRLRADLMDAMAGNGNPHAARAALDKLSALQNERIVLAMQARNEARAVLTPAQRTKAEARRGPGNRMRPAARGQRGDRVGARGPAPRGDRVGARGQGPRGDRPGRAPGDQAPRGPRPDNVTRGN
jgi:Spy/CpxP family protein refolding chaperone